MENDSELADHEQVAHELAVADLEARGADDDHGADARHRQAGQLGHRRRLLAQDDGDADGEHRDGRADDDGVGRRRARQAGDEQQHVGRDAEEGAHRQLRQMARRHALAPPEEQAGGDEHDGRQRHARADEPERRQLAQRQLADNRQRREHELHGDERRVHARRYALPLSGRAHRLAYCLLWHRAWMLRRRYQRPRRRDRLRRRLRCRTSSSACGSTCDRCRRRARRARCCRCCCRSSCKM